MDYSYRINNAEENIESERTPFILNGRFYKITKRDKNNVTAECCACKREYNGNMYASSNFLKHLAKKHKEIFAEYEKYKSTDYVPPQKKRNKAQIMKTSATSCSETNQNSSQNLADQYITKFIIESASPMSLVDLPAFKELIFKLNKLPDPVCCISHDNLSKNIIAQYEDMNRNILISMKGVSYFSTTADVWSFHQTSYLGVTLHWLDQNLMRKSYAIACKRFKDKHSLDNILLKLVNIHEKFGLSKKNIPITVTDNASNFGKYFADFGLSFEQNDNEGGWPSFTSLPSLSDLESNQVNFEFPGHHRCAAYTLSLVAAVDVEKSVNNNDLPSEFHKNYETSLATCAAIWNLLLRSPKIKKIFVEKCGHLVRQPCQMRWNSLCDAIGELLELEKQELYEFCTDLQLATLNDANYEFLMEYHRCLTPIAKALEVLQDQNVVFMGDLMPLILNAKLKLTEILDSSLKYCREFVEFLIDRLQSQFSYIFNWHLNTNDESMFYVLASLSHPKWKCNWVDKNLMEIAQDLFIQELKRFPLSNNAMPDRIPIQLRSDKLKFFTIIDVIFADEDFHADKDNLIELQATQFFCDKDMDISMLNNYPVVKQMFQKYNSAISSCGPVHRFFNFDDIAKYSTLKDSNFEILTLLNANVESK